MLYTAPAMQERWSEAGAELASARSNPANLSGSPNTDPSAIPDGEQKVKRFLAFSTGASRAFCNVMEYSSRLQ